MALNHALIRTGFDTPVSLLRAVDAGTWSIVFPTLTPTTLAQFSNVALLIAFLSILEGSSIGTSLAARAGQRLDANQEMLGWFC